MCFSLWLQLAKQQLKDAFVRAQLGNWVKKPIEQDMFEVEIWLVNGDAVKLYSNSDAEHVVPSAQ